MLKRTALAVAVAGGLISNTPALADAIADGVALLPGAIDDVRVAGTWSRDGQSGVYRILIGRGGGNDITARMFIQWVVYHSDGSATLLETIEIAELAELEIDVIDYISESDQDGLTVYIHADNPVSGGDETFELFVFSPTQHDEPNFIPASCTRLRY